MLTAAIVGRYLRSHVEISQHFRLVDGSLASPRSNGLPRRDSLVPVFLDVLHFN